jgi:hypothetical protein
MGVEINRKINTVAAFEAKKDRVVLIEIAPVVKAPHG